MKIRPTSSHSIELRSSLHGLALLLGELVLEPFLLGGCRFTDLLEFSLKVDNPLFLLGRILQQVGPAFGPVCQRLSQYNKVVSTISTIQNQVITTRRRQLTVSAVLMVTMLVCKACMSSFLQTSPPAKGCDSS
jgi:hypothetical protein